ncbi:MAG: hypothetical protein ACM32J_16790 [Rhizobacter sp.]|jgi:hypothetical protein
MKTSVGSDDPSHRVDADADGASDLAERDFAEDGRTLPSPTAPEPAADKPAPAEPREAADKPAPDGPMESGRGQGRGPTTTETDPR